MRNVCSGLFIEKCTEGLTTHGRSGLFIEKCTEGLTTHGRSGVFMENVQLQLLTVIGTIYQLISCNTWQLLTLTFALSFFLHSLLLTHFGYTQEADFSWVLIF